jgi:phage N-6-adenine-methyltransferase
MTAPTSEHTRGKRRRSKKLGRSSVHFLSHKSDWSTPQWVFDILGAEFGFTLDPCATVTNAKCANFFTPTEDGLEQDWGKHTVFMNPPYGRAIAQWMRKAYDSAQNGATVVCLIPARTDTKWWHQFAMKGEVRLIRGRIRFDGAKHGAPFPSAVVVFRPAD